MKQMNYDDVLAVAPVYTEYGANASRLYRADGTVTEETVRVSTVMKRLCAAFAVDQRALLRQAGEKLNRCRHLPLVISPRRVYISFPMRRPVTRDDGGEGRVRLDAISTLREADGCTELVLTSGVVVPVLLRLSRVKERLCHGKLLAQTPGRYMRWQDDNPDRPVTLGDLQAVMRRVMEIDIP